ncbi:hypothetical protein N8I77_002773 [Diaporthe amygdali]|uniref:Major facilitator superfamily (MFS) profile domain-containing protein n=1 Tax=Phomopsis amygdali TaxID=1214568 RepID=A0AAD9SUH0_PHOAM|nr:hypothetical protein N8I77_002773 [Diaporthe amygdali]
MEKRDSVELAENGSVLKTQDGTTETIMNPDDPMMWSWLQKHSILACISLLGGLGTYAGLFIVPAYGLMSMQFNRSVTEVSYLVGIYVLVLGAGPLIWNPFAQILGRRPVYIASTAVALGGAIWGACARSYGSMAGARVLLAFGLSAVHALGGITVADIFPKEVRGEKIGWWTLLTTLGPFLGPILAAYIVQGTGNWYWIFGHLAIALGAILIYMFVARIGHFCGDSKAYTVNSIFFVPETLYFQGNIQEQHQARRLSVRLKPFKHAEVPKWSTAFFRPLIMLRYPACWLPAFWFAWTFSWSVGIGTIITILFRRNYQLMAPNVNLVYIAPLVGAVLGELAGGPFSDFVVQQMTRRNQGQRHPEMRLHAMYPALICIVVGLVMFGVTLQQQKHYIIPLVGLGIFIFGMQASTTVVFTYPVDCYLAQGADALALIGGLKNVVSFALPFYINPMVDSIGIQTTFVAMAVISLGLYFVFVFSLIFCGERLREWAGQPGWNRSMVRPPAAGVDVDEGRAR